MGNRKSTRTKKSKGNTKRPTAAPLPEQPPSGSKRISTGRKRGYDEVTNSDEEFRQESLGILPTVGDSDDDAIQATVPLSQHKARTPARKKVPEKGRETSRRQAEEGNRNNGSTGKRSSRPSSDQLRRLRENASRQGARVSPPPTAARREDVTTNRSRVASQPIVTPIVTQDTHHEDLVTPQHGTRRDESAFPPTAIIPSTDIAANPGRRVVSAGSDVVVEERNENNPEAVVSRQAERLNRYKVQLQELKVELRTQKVLNIAVTEEVARLKETITRLEQENESLRAVATTTEPVVTADGEPVRSTQRPKQKRYEMKVPIRFLGIASSIERSILAWCRRETMELVACTNENTREWKGRSTSVTTYGFTTESFEGGRRTMFVPFAPWDVAEKGDYYISSYESEIDLIAAMARKELEKDRWSSLFPDEDLRKECIEEVCKDRGLRSRARQMLSDCVGGRKRNARGKLLQFLGYSGLVSRSPKPRTVEEMEERNRQKEEVVEKLLSIQTTMGIPDDLSWWRMMDIQSLAYSKWQVPFSLTEKRTGDQLFRHPFAVDVLHDFRGYAIRDGEREMESSIMLLARLDAWVATVVFCFDDTVGQGGKRQRQFQQIYSKLLPVAVKQLLNHVYGIVQSQVSNELVLAMNQEDGSDRFGNESRRATTVLSTGKPNKYYLAVDQKRFSDFVSSAMGSILDCFIAQTSDDGRMELVDVEGNRIESYPDGDPDRYEYPSPSLHEQGRGREFEDT